MILIPPFRTVAAKIGKTAFFDPSTVISPFNFCPPIIEILLTKKHPHESLVDKYAPHNHFMQSS
jgi:hypothetical protein